MSGIPVGKAAQSSILVYAPERDGELCCRLLTKEGLPCVRKHSEEEVLASLQAGTALALLLAEEYLTAPLATRLKQFVESQPAWSDLPFLIVARQDNRGQMKALSALGNVSILTRPMSPDALSSQARAAMRARSRQLEVHALLDRQAEQSRRKDDFLAMLAHELRNPLAPIRYAAHALGLPSFPHEKVPGIASLVERQLEHMSNIIDQLLEVSRLTRGLVKIQRQVIDLSQLVRHAVQAHKPVATEKGVVLEEHVEEAIRVNGDATRLTQVLVNLIDNAIKFSPNAGTVQVHLEADGDSAQLRVVDQGDGLDQAVLSHLFEPFTQADRSLERARGGLGLGLAVVKGLMQLHGGEVQARSDGPGCGSVFTVRLPRVAQLPSEPVADALPGPESHAKRVLIAEDNEDAAQSLRLVLEMSGYQVTVAESGDTALDHARQFRPDIIVCDIGLPGKDGYEVARMLRSRPETQDAMMIAVTGYGGEENRKRAFAAGFDAHFSKPVDPNALLGHMEAAL